MKTPAYIKKAGHPLFLLSIALLLLNDLYLKQACGNAFTGKLSDVAGLFMFPFLCSILFSRTVLLNYIVTAVIFVFWKSEASNSIVHAFNSMGVPIGRVVDYTDLWALLILPFSYYCFRKESPEAFNRNAFRYTAVCVAVFSTLATSKAKMHPIPISNVNKHYPFPIPLSTLAWQFNTLQLKYIEKYREGLPVQFDKQRAAFYVTYGAYTVDTIAQLIDYKRIRPTDTISIKTSFAKIELSGDEHQSSITLSSIAYLDYAPSYADREDLKETEKKVAKSIRIFEKEIINKIKTK